MKIQGLAITFKDTDGTINLAVLEGSMVEGCVAVFVKKEDCNDLLKMIKEADHE